MLTQADPEIRRDDTTPSVLSQAAANNWRAGLYDFGNDVLNSVTYFNPGLIKRPDGLWLLVRRAENEIGNPIGMNSVWAVKLDDAGTRPLHGRKLIWNGKVEGQQHEDARAFYVPAFDQVGVSVCTFKWNNDGTWSGAAQMLGFFDKDWNCKSTHFVPFDTNARDLSGVPPARYQKNWLFWMHGGKLHLLYKSNPWFVVVFGDTWERPVAHTQAGAQWNYGEIRGGTTPLLLPDGNYITFFHSSLPWRGNYRRYYAGAVTFSAEAPFTPIAITREPLLTGSQQGVWAQRKPACVFPCGAVLGNDELLVTLGLNDLAAAWLKLPLADVLKRLSPIRGQETEVLEPPKTETQTPIVPPKPPKEAPPQTAEPDDALKKKRQAQAAKMRAAKVAKKRLEPAAVAV